MKKLFLIALSIFTVSHSYASDTLSSDISKATVFLSGAQVFRLTKTSTIKKGVNEMIIKDVSPYLNQQQIQATAKGSFLILDVQYKTEHIAPIAGTPSIVPAKIQKEIDVLNDSLLFISFERDRITAKLGNLQEEKNMIMQNQLIASGGISDTLPEFKDIVEFYRLKLDEIHELVHDWKKKQHYVGAREAKHRARLNELKAYSNNIGQPARPARTRHHILVTTYSEFQTSGKIEVNYLVPNAGWIPAYDLRADNTEDPMMITYKASVYQNSGEDWEDVDLILSTYNQNCFTSKPTIGIWRLDYTINKIGRQSNGLPQQQFAQNFSSEVEMSEFQNGYKLQDGMELNVTNKKFIPLESLAEINQNFSNVEFDVKMPYSIKSDGSQKLMVVTFEKIKADFYHYMLPRANKYGFLLAKIGDWESLNLLPGKANIYFNQTYVGSTSIKPAVMSDTMELTLGRDQGIVANRKKTDEVSKNVGLKRTRKTLTFELEIKNGSKSDITLSLEDQVPVTSNEEIEIKVEDKGGAKFDPLTGMLTWDLELKPGEKKIVTFSYSVEHERTKPIS